VFGVNLLSTTYQPQGRISKNADKEWNTRSVNLLFKYRPVYPVYETKIYSLKFFSAFSSGLVIFCLKKISK
jgi:hypothetical protein